MAAANNTDSVNGRDQEGEGSVLNEAADVSLVCELNEQTKRLWARLTHRDVAFKAIQDYLDLSHQDANYLAVPNTSDSDLEEFVARRVERSNRLEGIRRKMLAEMNHVTLEKLASSLACDSHDSLNEWVMTDPVKRPVVEALVELERTMELYRQGVESMMASELLAIAASTPTKNVPILPCTLLSAIQFAVRGEKVNSTRLFESFLKFWDTREDRFAKEIATLRIEALAGIQGADFWHKEGKPVTQISTLYWIVKNFGDEWQSRNSQLGLESSATQEDRALAKKKKQAAAAAGNNSRETKKWLTVCHECVKHFENKGMPDTLDERREALNDFLSAGPDGEPIAKDPRTRSDYIEFLGTLLNNPGQMLDDSQIESVLYHLQSPQAPGKQPKFKAVTLEIVKKCCAILGDANLISPLRNS